MGYWSAVRGFWVRLGAIVIKEVMPLCRDRLSFAMMFGMPILELLLFGYAIDTDPHHLPTAVVVADQSRITRTVLSALANTGYMDFTHRPLSESEASLPSSATAHSNLPTFCIRFGRASAFRRHVLIRFGGLRSPPQDEELPQEK